MKISGLLKEKSSRLKDEVNELSFSEPVAYVYNPLEYAWNSYSLYLEKYGNSRKKTVLLGMNPGPWGMAQVGVPFGEIRAIRDWLEIEAEIGKPVNEHPKRPVEGFACKRSEVSGRRLWGLFKDRFKSPAVFFADHFVANYCPLVFMEDSGRNRTPDKLKADERDKLLEICDSHLRDVISILEPEWLIGVGGFAEKSAKRALDGMNIKIGRILHPSPASPAANRDWAGTASGRMIELGLWDSEND